MVLLPSFTYHAAHTATKTRFNKAAKCSNGGGLISNVQFGCSYLPHVNRHVCFSLWPHDLGEKKPSQYDFSVYSPCSREHVDDGGTSPMYGVRYVRVANQAAYEAHIRYSSFLVCRCAMYSIAIMTILY